MRCVIHVNHPAHVHLFKNLIYLLKKNGSEVIVIASKKNLTFELLELFGIKYIDIGSYGNTIREKLINVPIIDLRTLNIIKKYSPDIFIGMGSIVNSHVSSLLNKPCVNFTDTEHSVEQLILYYFFTNYIVTPNSFKKYFGQKHVRYNGYQELAYLHPNWFTPDKNILNKINMTVDDKIIVIRLVKWNSTHDIKHHGIENKFALIDELKDHANIIITSEEKDKRLEKFSYNLSPDKRLYVLEEKPFPLRISL